MSRADVKVVLLGHEAVGKTSLVARFINERFNESSHYQNVGTLCNCFFVYTSDSD